MNKEVLFRPNTEKLFDTFLYFAQSEHCPPRSVPVVLQWTSTNPYIYYNTEQMTRPECLQDVIDSVKRHPPVEVWDYSAANVAILDRVGIKARHVPLHSPSWYVEKLRAMRGTNEFDVGFCGTLNPRRLLILDELRKRGLRVNVVTGHGDYRDAELAKCRMLINIHYTTSYLVFEQLRCEPWIQVGVPIVSEHSLDNDARVINASYEELVDATLDVLSRVSK
jgi:hypothetical protein